MCPPPYTIRVNAINNQVRDRLYNRIRLDEWKSDFIIEPGFMNGIIIFTFHSSGRMEFVYNNTTGFLVLIEILHPGYTTDTHY